jgi:hypothetical protein
VFRGGIIHPNFFVMDFSFIFPFVKVAALLKSRKFHLPKKQPFFLHLKKMLIFKKVSFEQRW